jgi:hypothetical protein
MSDHVNRPTDSLHINGQQPANIVVSLVRNHEYEGRIYFSVNGRVIADVLVAVYDPTAVVGVATALAQQVLALFQPPQQPNHVVPVPEAALSNLPPLFKGKKH